LAHPNSRDVVTLQSTLDGGMAETRLESAHVSPAFQTMIHTLQPTCSLLKENASQQFNIWAFKRRIAQNPKTIRITIVERTRYSRLFRARSRSSNDVDNVARSAVLPGLLKGIKNQKNFKKIFFGPFKPYLVGNPLQTVLYRRPKMTNQKRSFFVVILPFSSQKSGIIHLTDGPQRFILVFKMAL
jgi:hypothetical protein